MRAARLFFRFFFLGFNGFQHISGLGDVREIDLGDDGLRGARRRCIRMRSRLRGMRKVSANLHRLVQLERTGVGFALANAEFRKNIENRARLDFKLFREIVNTNLAHPPLFESCAAKPT